jgi:hypothetical protein
LAKKSYVTSPALSRSYETCRAFLTWKWYPVCTKELNYGSDDDILRKH